MITHCNGRVWKTTPNTPISMLPYYVNTVAKSGGEFLINGQNFINVREAKQSQEQAYQHALDARAYLALSEISHGQSSVAKTKMVQAAIAGGKSYYLYVRDLNLCGQPLSIPPIPSFISAHPELHKYWDEGFYSTMAKLTDYTQNG